MEMTGEQLVPASQQDTWNALNDPAVLKECVPGCETIEPTGENEYRVEMVARVGPVSARFKGKLALSNIDEPRSYSISFEGQGGAAGFGKGSADVRLEPEAHGTKLAYAVKASVGGKLAQIGSRLVDAAAKKIADDFFRRFNEKMAATHEHGAIEGHQHDEQPPIPPDPDLPAASDTALRLFAAAALVGTAVALFAWLGG